MLYRIFSEFEHNVRQHARLGHEFAFNDYIGLSVLGVVCLPCSESAAMGSTLNWLDGCPFFWGITTSSLLEEVNYSYRFWGRSLGLRTQFLNSINRTPVRNLTPQEIEAALRSLNTPNQTKVSGVKPTYKPISKYTRLLKGVEVN